MSEIPKIFYDNDTIFHYCNSSVAVENILYEKQLRLTSRKKSNDPIENLPNKIFDSISAYPEDIQELKKTTAKSFEKIENNIKSRIKNIKQVCFCMNDKKINLNTQSKEYFGFLKPRMWDQYGDNYKGICLAFSKSELLKDQKIKLKKNIVYLNYKKLEQQNIDLDRNEINEIGYKKYNKISINYIDKTFFRKHLDYKGENEYRICTMCENEYDYIGIEKSIIGIIVCPEHINAYTCEKLTEYANDMNIELLYITWKNDGVTVNKELHSSNFKIIFKHIK